MSRFTSIMLFSPLADGKTWFLMRAFGYDVGVEDGREQITGSRIGWCSHGTAEGGCATGRIRRADNFREGGRAVLLSVRYFKCKFIIIKK